MARIVVLDDDEVIAQLLRTVIADAGDVPIVGHALRDIPLDARPDVVVTDLLPVQAYQREQSKRWIDQLRTRFPHVPIVIVTAHVAATSEPDALGANGIVVKPFDVEHLLSKIRALVASSRQPARHLTS